MVTDEDILQTVRLFYVWKSMKERCYGKSNPSYPDYGGRGIYVCDTWRTNFLAFCRWMLNNGSVLGTQIDRVNNDGPYCPENCRVTTPSENMRNRRNTRTFTAWGETKTIYEWENDPRMIVRLKSAMYRVDVLKWSHEDALSKPIDMVRKPVNKESCPLGHYYTLENTYTTPSQPKVKKCRTCHSQRQGVRYHTDMSKKKGY